MTIIVNTCDNHLDAFTSLGVSSDKDKDLESIILVTVLKETVSDENSCILRDRPSCLKIKYKDSYTIVS